MPYVRKSDRTITQHQPSGEAEFNFGILYRTIEEHVERFAKEAGPTHSVADIAERVGELLRSKAKNVRAQYRATELLLEMRENGASTGEGTGDRSGWETRETVHVRARSGEALNGRRKDYGKPQNPERVERIRKMLVAGMSRNEIGQALGVSAAAIHHQIRHYDLDNGLNLEPAHRGPGKGIPKNESKLEKIRKMLGSGMTRQDVADAMGMTKDGVGYWVRTYKIEEPVTQGVDSIGRTVTKRKAYTKKNPHWTQKPENRERVAKWMRKMKRMKNAKEKQ